MLLSKFAFECFLNEIHFPEGLEAFDRHLKLVLDGIALPRLRRPAWEGGPITFDSCEAKRFQKRRKSAKTNLVTLALATSTSLHLLPSTRTFTWDQNSVIIVIAEMIFNF